MATTVAMRRAFGRKLKAAREAHGWTCAEAAAALSKARPDIRCSPQVWQWWESGFTTPRLMTAAHVAELLGTSVDELLGREVAPPPAVTPAGR